MEFVRKIKAAVVNHHGEKRILLKFDFDRQLQKELQNNFGARYSATHKCWHVASSPGVLKQIENFFKPNLVVETDHKAGLNSLVDISEVVQTVPELPPYPDLPTNIYSGPVSRPVLKSLPALSGEHLPKVEAMRTWMLSRRYSNSTIKTYTEGLTLFLRYVGKKNIEDISNEDLLDFDRNYILAHHLSPSFQNQVINAVKLFFARIELRSMHIDRIFRPKRAKVLPNVISKEEVKAILEAPSNIKHKAMLSLIYACGLRCGEILSLKPEHLDSKRGLVVIKQAKGKKDRIVPLSKKVQVLLRTYFVACKPKVWLFEGQKPYEKYDERSLQSVLKQALVKAKIDKPVTLHWLRHSFATHLLESGTDLRYIQELLGHSRSTTTEIYTHVSNKEIQRIVSPFDTL